METARRKLLCRARKEAEPSVEEANTCCTEMWKGQWGILYSGEHPKVSCGSKELRGGTGVKRVVVRRKIKQ